MRRFFSILSVLVVPALAACAVDPAASATSTDELTSSGSLHTEDNEVVCELDDFLSTKIFVDRDRTLDGNLGQLSSKVLEMPTQNAHGNNNRLFQVTLFQVQRARCPNCADTQVILYKSDGDAETLKMLELTSSHAKLTANVDADGKPLIGSFVSEGPCKANEPD